MATCQSPPTELLQVRKLRLHDLISKILPVPDEEAVKATARKLRATPDEPVVTVHPNGTILCGWEAYLAAQSLRLRSVVATVRDDLADTDEVVVALHVAALHLDRSHPDHLEAARVWREWQKWWEHWRRCRPRQGCGRARATDLNAMIQSLFSRSRRELERYGNVLFTPQPVRDAVRAGRLAVTQAERMARLPYREQQQIADAILAGVDPKQAVAAHVPATDTCHKEVGPAVLSATRAFTNVMKDFEGRADQVTLRDPEMIAVWRRMDALLSDLLARARPIEPGRDQLQVFLEQVRVCRKNP